MTYFDKPLLRNLPHRHPHNVRVEAISVVKVERRLRVEVELLRLHRDYGRLAAALDVPKPF